MALKNAIFQPWKKETIGSASEVSMEASITSGNRRTRVITRGVTKANASNILKQQIVAPTLQSYRTQTFGSDLPTDAINQIVCLRNLN